MHIYGHVLHDSVSINGGLNIMVVLQHYCGTGSFLLCIKGNKEIKNRQRKKKAEKVIRLQENSP
jgi:hypothetical protein